MGCVDVTCDATEVEAIAKTMREYVCRLLGRRAPVGDRTSEAAPARPRRRPGARGTLSLAEYQLGPGCGASSPHVSVSSASFTLRRARVQSHPGHWQLSQSSIELVLGHVAQPGHSSSRAPCAWATLPTWRRARAH